MASERGRGKFSKANPTGKKECDCSDWEKQGEGQRRYAEKKKRLVAPSENKYANRRQKRTSFARKKRKACTSPTNGTPTRKGTIPIVPRGRKKRKIGRRSKGGSRKRLGESCETAHALPAPRSRKKGDKGKERTASSSDKGERVAFGISKTGKGGKSLLVASVPEGGLHPDARKVLVHFFMRDEVAPTISCAGKGKKKDCRKERVLHKKNRRNLNAETP